MSFFCSGPVLPIRERSAFVQVEFMFKMEFMTSFSKNLWNKLGLYVELLPPVTTVFIVLKLVDKFFVLDK